MCHTYERPSYVILHLPRKMGLFSGLHLLHILRNLQKIYRGLGVMYLSYRYVMAGSECSENPRPRPNTHLGHMCYYDDQTDIL